MHGGLRANHNYRHCKLCGWPLAVAERCECGLIDVPSGWPRDGLRAGCPQFVARSSYRGQHYLNCDGHKLRAGSRVARDTFYATYCCGDAATRAACPFWMGRKEDDNVGD